MERWSTHVLGVARVHTPIKTIGRTVCPTPEARFDYNYGVSPRELVVMFAFCNDAQDNKLRFELEICLVYQTRLESITPRASSNSKTNPNSV